MPYQDLTDCKNNFNDEQWRFIEKYQINDLVQLIQSEKTKQAFIDFFIQIAVKYAKSYELFTKRIAIELAVLNHSVPIRTYKATSESIAAMIDDAFIRLAPHINKENCKKLGQALSVSDVRARLQLSEDSRPQTLETDLSAKICRNAADSMRYRTMAPLDFINLTLQLFQQYQLQELTRIADRESSAVKEPNTIFEQTPEIKKLSAYFLPYQLDNLDRLLDERIKLDPISLVEFLSYLLDYCSLGKYQLISECPRAEIFKQLVLCAQFKFLTLKFPAEDHSNFIHEKIRLSYLNNPELNPDKKRTGKSKSALSMHTVFRKTAEQNKFWEMLVVSFFTTNLEARSGRTQKSALDLAKEQEAVLIHDFLTKASRKITPVRTGSEEPNLGISPLDVPRTPN